MKQNNEVDPAKMKIELGEPNIDINVYIYIMCPSAICSQEFLHSTKTPGHRKKSENTQEVGG